MSTKLKCVLLDDEIPGLKYLKMLCEQIPELDLVKAYNDPQKFITESSSLAFELCILDIEMPKLSGMQVASLLHDKLIIFTTAYRDYAADAFDLNAVDFVRKPVTKERLQQAVQKALERKVAAASPKQYLQLNTDKGKSLIDLHQIAFITTSKVDARDKVATMLDNSSWVLKNISFEFLQSQLPGNHFCRVNKKQLIAIKIVTSFTFDEITTSLKNEEKAVKFSLSEAYRQQFQNVAKQVS